jgi:hypothetical protein
MSKNKTTHQAPKPVISSTSSASAQQISIDGISYNLAELPEVVKLQLGNVRVVDQELKRLDVQRGIAKVARANYVNAVAAALPKEPTPPADGARSAVIDGVSYDWASLGERVQGLLTGIRAADQEMARLNTQMQLAQTARGAFAQEVKQNLPKGKSA